MPALAPDITIRCDRRPGDDALIVALHRDGYQAEGDKFGPTFPDYVAKTVAEAALDTPSASRVWFAQMGEDIVGCTAMIDRGDRGQVRWVVVLPKARGLGVGRELVVRAIEHARAQGWREVFLETTTALDASMSLYLALGFEIVREEDMELWNGPATLIVMRLGL